MRWDVARAAEKKRRKKIIFLQVERDSNENIQQNGELFTRQKSHKYYKIIISRFFFALWPSFSFFWVILCCCCFVAERKEITARSKKKALAVMSNLEWERNSRNAKNGNVSFVLKITLSDIAFFELPRAVTISTEETDEVGSTSPTNFHLSSCERRGQVECSTWINDHFADVFMSHLIRQCCAGSLDSSKERMCVSAPSNDRFEHICNAISYWNRRERCFVPLFFSTVTQILTWRRV